MEYCKNNAVVVVAACVADAHNVYYDLKLYLYNSTVHDYIYA